MSTNNIIRECGGVQASIDFLKTTTNKDLALKGAKFVSSMAINGASRKEYQDLDAGSIMQNVIKTAKGNELKEALSMAIQHVNATRIY